MKRFQVARLFQDPKLDEAEGTWIDAEKDLPKSSGTQVVKVKRSNGDVTKAYFCSDQVADFAQYYQNWIGSYFWDYDKEIPITDVTHWLKLGKV